jgi:hypothetical protein
MLQSHNKQRKLQTRPARKEHTMSITPQATAPERLANIKPLKIGSNDGFEGNRRSDTLVARFQKALKDGNIQMDTLDASAVAVAIAIDGGMLRWVLTVEPNGKTKEGKAPLLTEPAEGSASMKIPALGVFKGGYECIKDGKIMRSRDGKAVAVGKVTPLTKQELIVVQTAGISPDEAMLIKHLESHNMGGGIIAEARKAIKKEEAAAKKAEAAKQKKEAKPTEKAVKETKKAPKPPTKPTKAAPKPPKAEVAQPEPTPEQKPE